MHKVFDSSYEKTKHYQRGYDSQIIQDLLRQFQSWYPDKDQEIHILDIGCGDGGSTKELLEELNTLGYKKISIKGTDISSDQIAVAKKHEDTHLSFEVCSGENLKEQNRFDLVISLFALHWIADIKTVAKNVQRALKSEGRLMFFTVLEMQELFQIRQAFIKTDKWRDIFANFQMPELRKTAKEYDEVFQTNFQIDAEHCVRGRRPKQFTREDFITFLESWLPEKRFLLQTHPELIQEFMDEFVDTIPTTFNLYPDVNKFVDPENGEKQKQETFVFTLPYYWCHGKKSATLTLSNNTSLDSDKVYDYGQCEELISERRRLFL